MLTMKIKILTPLNLHIKLYKLTGYNFIIFEYLKVRFFFKLHKSIEFLKTQNKILFFIKQVSLNIYLSIQRISSKIASFFLQKKYFFCKKIFLQGLGFKIISIVQNDSIELKIGYSHNVKINIPIKSNLTLYVNNNMIVVEGSNKVKVGNFSNKIKSFRIPDSYKGKGIWYKKEIKILKEVKKT